MIGGISQNPFSAVRPISYGNRLMEAAQKPVASTNTPPVATLADLGDAAKIQKQLDMVQRHTQPSPSFAAFGGQTAPVTASQQLNAFAAAMLNR